MAPVILNEKQKQFLFDEGYVDAKALDAAVEPGWKEYFMRKFKWVLEAKPVNNTRLLVLTDIAFPVLPEYAVEIIFRKNDFEKLLTLK